MELTLKRIKHSNKYTWSRLYEQGNKNAFNLDVIEPPVEGLSISHENALPMGIYKIFLKPDPSQEDIVAVFQKVRRFPRCGFSAVHSDVNVLELDFYNRGKVFTQNVFLGQFDLRKYSLTPKPTDYNNFMIRLVIAKQNHEIIRINII